MLRTAERKPTLANNWDVSRLDTAYPDIWRGLSLLIAPNMGYQGSRLMDFSKNRRHGTIINGVLKDRWIQGPNGYQIDFSGTTDNITFPQVTALFPSCLMVVFTPRSTTRDWPWILTTEDNPTTYSGLTLQHNKTDGKIEAMVGNNAGTGSANRKSFLSDSGLTNATRYVIVCNFIDINTVELYFNGVLIGTTTSGSATNLGYGSAAGSIGRTTTGAASIDGSVETAMVWSGRTLNLAAVKLLTDNPLAPLVAQSRQVFVSVGGGPFLKSFTAGLSFSGSALKQTNKNLSGGVSFSGSVIKQTRKVFSAGLSFAGSTAKKTQKVFNASLSFSVSMFKKVFKVLSGGLSFSGSVGKIKTFVKAFAADLSFSGSMLKQTRKNLSGSLSFSGAMLKKMSKSFGAGLSFSGSAIKRTAKIFTGGLSFSGSLGRIKTFVKSFTAELSFSGGIVKRTNKVFSAGLSFSGGVLKRMTKSFTAGLSFSGAMLKQITKSFAAGLSFSGGVISALVGASALIVSDARIAVFNTAKSIIAFFTKDDNRDGKF